MTSIIMTCLALAFLMPGSQGLQEEQSLQDLDGYKLATLMLTNTSPLNSEFLRDHVFSINDGDPYDKRPIKEGMGKIVRLYSDLVYLDFAYNPHLDINQSEKTVTCSFEFIPGTRYSVNRIHVFGAESGEDESEIKSVLNLKETMFFSPIFFDRDLKRLSAFLEAKNLALEDYDFKRSPDHPGTVDISIRLQSKE
jgi:outer membrane protein assembly factor BamA